MNRRKERGGTNRERGVKRERVGDRKGKRRKKSGTKSRKDRERDREREGAKGEESEGSIKSYLDRVFRQKARKRVRECE